MTLSVIFKKTLYYTLVTLSILVSIYFISINLDELVKRSKGQYTVFSQMSWLTDGQAKIYCGFLTIIFICFMTLLGYKLFHGNTKGVTLICLLTIILAIVVLFSERLFYHKLVGQEHFKNMIIHNYNIALTKNKNSYFFEEILNKGILLKEGLSSAANIALALWRLKKLNSAFNKKIKFGSGMTLLIKLGIYNQLYTFNQHWFRREGILLPPQTPMLQRCLLNKLTLGKIILPLLLLTQTVYCWTAFYKAQFLQYDENYGLLINGFVISLAASFILAIMWFCKRQLIKENKVATILWTIIGSPLTFILTALYYSQIFGTILPG